MVKKLNWNRPEDIEFLKHILENNDIVISSTDTVYGFLANVTQDSWEKICDIKEIRQKRPFLILVSSIEKISNFVDISSITKKTLKFVDDCWPGPVTFIFRANSNLPKFLSSENGTVALRCPDHNGLQKILNYFDGLFSTSANKTMDPAPTKFDEISKCLLKKINYVIINGVEKENIKSSTLVDLSNPDYDKEFPFNIIRKGAYSVNRLKEVYLHQDHP